MKNIFAIIIGLLSFMTLSSCNSVQPVLLLTPGDLFWMPIVYVVLAYVLAKGLGKEKNNFWLWFVGCMILTPLFGILMIVLKLRK